MLCPSMSGQNRGIQENIFITITKNIPEQDIVIQIIHHRHNVIIRKPPFDFMQLVIETIPSNARYPRLESIGILSETDSYS